MVCVQVKWFPSWTTCVTTLWSVLALRSPVTEQGKLQIDNFKWMKTHIDLLLTFVSIKNNPWYQFLPETPRSGLDSPSHISQRKPWWRGDKWGRNEKEWPAEQTFRPSWTIAITTSSYSIIPHHVSYPLLWVFSSTLQVWTCMVQEKAQNKVMCTSFFPSFLEVQQWFITRNNSDNPAYNEHELQCSRVFYLSVLHRALINAYVTYWCFCRFFS